jgi:hypothetical protein
MSEPTTWNGGADERHVGRRSLLKGAAALGIGTISARGIYGVLGDIVRPTPAEAATTVTRRLQEQYLIEQLEVIVDNGVTLIIPPIYNDVFTAKLKSTTTWTSAALKAAKTRVENALVKVESPYPDTAAGLTIVVGWGLPYFRDVIGSTLSNKYLPWAPATATTPKQLAVVDAVRFPSDPSGVALEDNHVMFKFRSDSQTILRTVESQLFEDQNSGAYIGDLFDLKSKRMGFAGRGFNHPSVAKTLGLQRGAAGTESISDRAQLMMGFTSTQTQALGPGNIPSFETLRGVTDQWPAGYFAAGCAMHLSHMYLDLNSWYGKGYSERVGEMFNPRITRPTDINTVTIPNGPAQVSTRAQIETDAMNGKAGHNSLLQQATRLAADTIDNYGRLQKKGTPIPIREDFNTLDDPFAWLPGDTALREGSTPGLHFVAFVPSHLAFHKARLAMDGYNPDGTTFKMAGTQADFPVTGRAAGINGIMTATHRQNYVIPPRKNRSFPLAELRT